MQGKSGCRGRRISRSEKAGLRRAYGNSRRIRKKLVNWGAEMGIRTPFWGKSLIKNLSDVAVKALDSASKAVEMANKAMDKTGKKSSEVSGEGENAANRAISQMVRLARKIEQSTRDERSEFGGDEEILSDPDQRIVRNELIAYSGKKTHVVIVSGVVRIAPHVFENNRILQSVVIPDSVRKIGACAFAGCSALRQVKTHDSICEIDFEAFRDCVSLEGFCVDSGVRIIESFVFKGCTSLKAVFFAPEAPLIALRRGVFAGCKALKTIQWPRGIQSVPDFAIEDCPLSRRTISDLCQILVYSEKRRGYVLPGVLQNDLIKERDNRQWGNLSPARAYQYEQEHEKQVRHNQVVREGLYIEGDELVGLDPGHKSVVLGESIHKIAENAFNQGTDVEQIVVEGEMRRICAYVFSGLENLREIRFKKKVECIEKGAFEGCSGLQKVIFEEGLRDIGDNVFAGCSVLKEIVLPDNCTNIGINCFKDCHLLERIHLPRQLRKVPRGTFEACFALSEIEWPESVRIDGHDYPVVESNAFRHALLDDNWERFEFRGDVLKRVLVPVMEEDPDLLFTFLKQGNLSHIRRIGQLIANSVLNEVWERTALNDMRYEFQMRVFKCCMQIAMIVLAKSHEESIVERLNVLAFMFDFLMKTSDLTVSFAKLALPIAISKTLFAIGGNGFMRRKMDERVLEMCDPYMPYPFGKGKKVDEDSSSYRLFREAFHQVMSKELEIGENIPFRYDPYTFRNLIPVYDGICVVQDEDEFDEYYYFMHSMMSLVNDILNINIYVDRDLTHDSREEWFRYWGQEIYRQCSGNAFLVCLSPMRCAEKLEEDSLYYNRLKPLCDWQGKHWYTFVMILSHSQTEAIRSVLAEYDLEEMIAVYSDEFRMIC